MRGIRSPSTASLKLRRLHAYTILFRKPWSDTDSACTAAHGRKYSTIKMSVNSIFFYESQTTLYKQFYKQEVYIE